MANQIRSGGTQKTTTPVYSENGVRNAERVIENAYGLATNERLFEDGSIPADKISGLAPGGDSITLLESPVFYSVDGIALTSNILLSNLGVPDSVRYVLCGFRAVKLSPLTGTEFYLSIVFPNNTTRTIANGRLDEFETVVISSTIGVIPAYNSTNIRLNLSGNEGISGTFDLLVSTIGYIL